MPRQSHLRWVAETKVVGGSLTVTRHESELDADEAVQSWLKGLDSADELVVCQIYEDRS